MNISISTVNLLHSIFSITAVVSAALALIAGAGTFWTSSLRDRFSEIEQRRLQQQLRDADASLSSLQRSVAPRRLSSEQRTVMVPILRRATTQQFSITCAMGDGESYAYAQDFESLLIDAGWVDQAGGIAQCVWTGPVPGVFISVREGISALYEAPPGLGVLIDALAASGIDISTTIHGHKEPAQVISLSIGHRSGSVDVLPSLG